MAEVLVPVAEEIIGTIIIDGAKYLLKKVVDSVGKAIWQAFADEDGDNLPDDPENPFQSWDEEPDTWLPLPSLPSGSETSSEISIIIVSPDGTMTIYDGSGKITNEVADTAYSLWLSENRALDKPFNNYTVSEFFLFFVAAASVVFLLGKIFKRRKF